MTQTTQTIFEKYQVRKTKRQKLAFEEYIRQLAQEQGYSFNIQKGLGARNIVIGDISGADVVYTAHYDTCVRLPFPNFITPKNIGIYLIYQIALGVVMYFALFICSSIAGFLADVIGNLIGGPAMAYIFSSICFDAVLIGFLLLLLAGPANKHTANDNTSGVTTLVDIMTSLPTECRQKVAFVFFDLEEAGLIGSTAFSFKYRKAMKQKLLLNFDCVSDGKNIIFAVKRKAKKYVPMLQKAFEGDQSFNVEVLTRGVFDPSDQAKFNCGVGVMALKKTKLFNILYMNRIHTNKDTVYCEENIEFFKDGSVRLVKLL